MGGLKLQPTAQQTHFAQLYLFAFRLSLWPLLVLAAASPAQEKAERSGSGGSGAAAPDYRTARRR